LFEIHDPAELHACMDKAIPYCNPKGGKVEEGVSHRVGYHSHPFWSVCWMQGQLVSAFFFQ
jgi:hypothetical protein